MELSCFVRVLCFNQHFVAMLHVLPFTVASVGRGKGKCTLSFVCSQHNTPTPQKIKPTLLYKPVFKTNIQKHSSPFEFPALSLVSLYRYYYYYYPKEK